MRLEDFILIKDNVFTKEFCQELIDFFENNPDLRHKGEMAGGLNTEVKDTTDLNLFNYPDLMEKYGDFVLSKFNEVVNEYAESLPFQNKFLAPSVLFYENTEYTTCQIQKYDKGEGHYNAYHFETDNAENCCRVFVFIFYLNDVDEGGETGMLYSNTKIKPKAGRVICHPATFPFVHNGHTPISDDKYILTTWLNYV